jgi:hypothetical protein
VKSESEAIAYLVSLFEDTYPKITLPQHEGLMDKAKEMQNQLTF